MDFGKLLSFAKRNTSDGRQNDEGRYYSTKFAPPKKENKEKKLSDNIKKFLAKKEEEERVKELDTRRKTEELIAKRDVKAKKKIEKMLKVIKSANKSVLDDATDAQASAIALAGTEQPDEDDYGYTSNVASQFYQQLMDKYKSNPEEQKFKLPERRTMSKEDLARTRARVKDAIMRQVEEENGPRTRKSRAAGAGGGGGVGDERDVGSKYHRGPDSYDAAEEQRCRVAADARVKTEEKKRFQGRKGSGAPPPPDFATLLKLAEQKHKEPVRINTTSTPEKRRQEPERLMTKREKKEHDERMAFFEMKRMRDRIKDDPKLSDKEKQHRLAKLDGMRAAGNLPGIPAPHGESGARLILSPSAPSTRLAPMTNVVPLNTKTSSQSSGVAVRPATTGPGSGSSIVKQYEHPHSSKIRKRSDQCTDQLTKKSATDDSLQVVASSSTSSISSPSSSSLLGSSHVSKGRVQIVKIKDSSGSSSSHKLPSSALPVTSKSSLKSTSKDILPIGQGQRSKIHPSSGNTSSKSFSNLSSSVSITGNSKSVRPSIAPSSPAGPMNSNLDGALKNAPRQLELARCTVNSRLPGKPKRPSTEGVTQTRQFPPPDLQRSLKRPIMRQNGQQRPATHSSTLKKRRVIGSDSEYDSEMDDFIDDGDCEEDYSSAIKEIFGYDKSRYRDEHYDDDEDYNMESSYAQQMREEYISKKIGIMEDLEDMRMEEEEKRRKSGKQATTAKKKK